MYASLEEKSDAGIGAQESIGARPLGESASNLEGEPSSSKKRRVDPRYPHVGSSINPQDQEQQPAANPPGGQPADPTVSSFSSFPSLPSIESLPSIDRSEREPSVERQDLSNPVNPGVGTSSEAGPSHAIPAVPPAEVGGEVPLTAEILRAQLKSFLSGKRKATNKFVNDVAEELKLESASPWKLRKIQKEMAAIMADKLDWELKNPDQTNEFFSGQNAAAELTRAMGTWKD